jgi:hypothetical protein
MALIDLAASRPSSRGGNIGGRRARRMDLSAATPLSSLRPVGSQPWPWCVPGSPAGTGNGVGGAPRCHPWRPALADGALLPPGQNEERDATQYNPEIWPEIIVYGPNRC